jgi:general secretion pathway protein G
MPALAGDDSNIGACHQQLSVWNKKTSLRTGTRIANIDSMNTTRHSASRGFSIIELLIVVAVIGLIVAIAIPNLVNAIQRARQSRTLADAQSIGKGVSMYQQDVAKFPVAATDTHAEVLRSSLAPYLRNYSSADGWMRPFLYTSTDGDHYTVISHGLDGEATLPYTSGPTHSFDEDIVITDGMFKQYPEGVQN